MRDLNLEYLLESLPGIIIGLSVHEFCHAWVAWKCGDTLAKEQGRITLNPIKHLDLLGFIFIVVAGFGWAKPVQFNPEKLKNRRVDTIKIAMAGPLSNVVLALLFSVLYVIAINVYPGGDNQAYNYFLKGLLYAIVINWGLFVFNMIPLPPLDGSYLFFSTIENPVLYQKIYRFGTIALFGILIFSATTKIDILPIGKAAAYLGNRFFELIGYASPFIQS